MTKWQTRQALYLLGLTGILYLFSCKSQAIVQQCNRVCQENLLIFLNFTDKCIYFLLFSNITPSEAPQYHHTYSLPVHNRHTLPSDVR